MTPCWLVAQAVDVLGTSCNQKLAKVHVVPLVVGSARIMDVVVLDDLDVVLVGRQCKCR